MKKISAEKNKRKTNFFKKNSTKTKFGMIKILQSKKFLQKKILKKIFSETKKNTINFSQKKIIS